MSGSSLRPARHAAPQQTSARAIQPVGRAFRDERMQKAPTCTVYFDGACPLCRAEIAHYRRQRGADSVAWIDASTCDDGAFGPDLDRSAALARFHVREADGSLASGAAAFVAVWRRLPAFGWLAAVASTRPALALLEAAYPVFLRVRRRWRRPDEHGCPRDAARPRSSTADKGAP
jgi:predicted DCC family thiol-disulfide oxidoreductase YuxK